MENLEINEGFIVKTAIVHFFEVEIKYDCKWKSHAKNDGDIDFLWKQPQK